MPATSPSVTNSDLVTISLKSNGKEISSLYHLSSILVSTAVNRIPLALIELLDGSAPDETFAASESDDFAPGSVIEIALGYGSSTQRVFRGGVVKQTLQMCHGSRPSLIVECLTPAAQMDDGIAPLAAPDLSQKAALSVTYGVDIYDMKLETDEANISGTVRFQGSSQIAPGALLELNGMGTRFSAKIWVHGVSHHVADGNWLTEVSVGTDAAGAASGENRTLTQQTLAGNKLVLSDQDKSILLEDQHGNSIKLSADGIALTSKSNISITADQSLTAKGTQGVGVSGMKISLEADTDFTANGNAAATLQASGITTIKGAMVMIN